MKLSCKDSGCLIYLQHRLSSKLIPPQDDFEKHSSEWNSHLPWEATCIWSRVLTILATQRNLFSMNYLNYGGFLNVEIIVNVGSPYGCQVVLSLN